MLIQLWKKKNKTNIQKKNVTERDFFCLLDVFFCTFTKTSSLWEQSVVVGLCEVIFHCGKLN